MLERQRSHVRAIDGWFSSDAAPSSALTGYRLRVAIVGGFLAAARRDRFRPRRGSAAALHSLTLGTDADGWNERRAERKLEDVLAAIRAGVWQPPAPPDTDDSGAVTFHEFASRWWAAKRAEALRPKTQQDYEWQLRKHLLPFFAKRNVADVDVALVERYREEKLIEREQVKAAAASGHPMRDKRGQMRKPLSNDSIKKTLVTLSQILDSAVERGLLLSNPAIGRKRRPKTSKPVRRLLEADELKDLLAVAAEMDRTSRRYRIGRRPMIAVMAKSGLRVTEMRQLRWRDVDVHHQRLVIGEAKTNAGVREVDLSLDVMEELMTWRASRPRRTKSTGSGTCLRSRR
jgi:integrase